MKKTIYLLNINNYAPEVTQLTYPWIEFYASKIGADVCMISERYFPDWNIPYEKLQIHHLAKERGDDWAIYIDSDALVHPELPDLTVMIPQDTVAHNGADFAAIRWAYDHYFMRDGRNIGSCNWFTVASKWCLDLWRPLDDMTYEEVIASITVTADEKKSGLTSEHLVDDYSLSRNIARFGLKFTTLTELWTKVGLVNASFFHHEYTVTEAEKVEHIKQAIENWQI